MKRDKVPRHYLSLYDKALSGRRPMRAIRAHCLMCMGWLSSEVAACTAPGCPLYPYRLGHRRDSDRPDRAPGGHWRHAMDAAAPRERNGLNGSRVGSAA